MTLRSANHTVIRVVNTTQCHIIHQLVWYAHFIFYSEWGHAHLAIDQLNRRFYDRCVMFSV